MADACVFIMEGINFTDLKDQNSAAAPNEIRNTHINIGTGVDISIRDLALAIKEIVDFKGAIYFNADKPDGTMKKLTDVSKLHAMGWKHTVDLDNGIKMLYKYYLETGV